MPRTTRPRWLSPTPLLFVLSDSLVLLLVASVTVHVRYQLQGQFSYAQYFGLWPLLFLFLLTYAAMGLYPGVLLSPPEELKKSFWGTSLVFFALAVGTFLGREGHAYSRAIYLASWALAVVCLPLGRYLVRMFCARHPWWGYPLVIFCDESALSQRITSTLIAHLRRQPHTGLRPLAVVRIDDPELLPPLADGTPLFGLSRFLDSAGGFTAEFALITLPQCDQGQLQFLLERLARHFRTMVLVPNLAIRSSLWARSLDFFGVLGLQLEQKLLDPRRMLLKRTLDILVGVVLGVLLCPLLLGLALLIKLESPGPIVYGHRRVGRYGNPITILKFRTMVRDADQVLARYLADNEGLRAEWEAKHKLKHDPRITRVGHLLRKWSLDELPQLWNVLRGDLSLVGPRPIVEDEIRFYADAFKEYTQVLPGMTGLWQVSGRSDTSYDERVDLDMYYVRNWSIWLDIYIVIKTLPAVLAGKGY